MQVCISRFRRADRMSVRGWAVMLMVLPLAAPLRAAPADVDTRFGEAEKNIATVMARARLPGLVVGITDKEALRKVIVYGYADIKTRQPVTADTRFAVGSVSKAFTAIALLKSAEQGRFDPHAPITRYLPSFELKSHFAAVTGHDLLSHTSGLPNYLPDAASSRYAAIALRDFEPTYAPGAHWWYSNTGFQLLGYVLENIEHQPYVEVLRRQVLEPLGMHSTSAAIDDAQRARMAVSYAHWPYDDSYKEAPWFEYSAGDGSIVSNITDMSAYARLFLNRGRGPDGPILSENSFTQLTRPVLENYAYGLRVWQEGGHTIIGHQGTIAGFHSAVEAHVDEGFGVVLLSTSAVAAKLEKWLLETLGAAFTGKALPAPPPVAKTDLSLFAQSFTIPGTTETLVFSVKRGQLHLTTAKADVPLEPMGGDLFRLSGDAAEGRSFLFGRQGDKVTDVSDGERWYTTTSFPKQSLRPGAPKEYAAYVGHFSAAGPEGPVTRVFIRNGQLMMLISEDSDSFPEPLELIGSGLFRIGEQAYSPERAHFDNVVDGHALRMSITGVAAYRKDTP